MTTNSRHYFDANSYIETIAYSKANKAFKRAGQKRADYIYNMMMNNGLNLWADLTAKMPWYEAEIWLRKQFGNERGETAEKSVVKSCSKPTLKPGAECWAKYTIDEYENILKKVSDSVSGNKSKSNAERQLKNAVNNAELFVKIKPDFYDEERHGEYLSKSEFNSMLQSCKEIIAKYAVVSTLETAA